MSSSDSSFGKFLKETFIDVVEAGTSDCKMAKATVSDKLHADKKQLKELGSNVLSLIEADEEDKDEALEKLVYDFKHSEKEKLSVLNDNVVDMVEAKKKGVKEVTDDTKNYMEEDQSINQIKKFTKNVDEVAGETLEVIKGVRPY
jgi:hypothetical protein